MINRISLVFVTTLFSGAAYAQEPLCFQQKCGATLEWIKTQIEFGRVSCYSGIQEDGSKKVVPVVLNGADLSEFHAAGPGDPRFPVLYLAKCFITPSQDKFVLDPADLEETALVTSALSGERQEQDRETWLTSTRIYALNPPEFESWTKYVAALTVQEWEIGEIGSRWGCPPYLGNSKKVELKTEDGFSSAVCSGKWKELNTGQKISGSSVGFTLDISTDRFKSVVQQYFDSRMEVDVLTTLWALIGRDIELANTYLPGTGMNDAGTGF